VACLSTNRCAEHEHRLYSPAGGSQVLIDSFSSKDLARLASRGISLEEASRQLRLLRSAPKYARLVRPCTPGDGIETIAAARFDALAAAHAAVAGRSGCASFIPASGAASRMFQDLDKPGAGGELLGRWSRFAFAGESAANVSRLPKGLLAFHAYEDGPRTPLEEHLVEAAAINRDAQGVCRLHLTVSAEHLPRFREALERARHRYESSLRTRFDVVFSMQDPATDTLALGADGEPARGADGELVLRPAGHGALLSNLASMHADIALIKNIDNVQRDEGRGPTILWSRTLAGRLEELRVKASALRARLRDPSDAGASADAIAFASGVFHQAPRLGHAASGGGDPRALRQEAMAILDRPIRVCGVVPNSGEPGGGPFWVRDHEGAESLQIVEGAQVDPASREQRALLASATHFNPVFMACELAAAEGGRHDLTRFVDPDAAIITRKAVAESELTVLERPGLWNGAMAGWHTLFVEVPPATFTPVKTLMDLLRPEHQPPVRS